MDIDCIAFSKDIFAELKAEVKKAPGNPPCLAVVLVGDNPASQTYVGLKEKRCKEVGMRSRIITLPTDTSVDEILSVVKKLNEDLQVHGILVQQPVPCDAPAELFMRAVHPWKDVDGLHPENLGKTLMGVEDGFLSCTPFGILETLKRIPYDCTGKRVVVVGRSNIVGKPMAMMLGQKKPFCNATVTLAHTGTQNLSKVCREADVLIAAVGRPNTITADMVKEGAVVIDVGMNKVEDSSRKKGYRLVGDVDYPSVAPKCSWITPVPKGVGRMTVAMLLVNTLKAFRQQSST